MRIERLIMGLTYRCQCNCVHCSQGTYRVSKAAEISTEKVFEVIDTASRYKLKELNVFGGEALLREDIFEILERGRAGAQVVTLDTNGVGVTEDVARRLKEVGVDHIYMSLFSTDPGTNALLYRRKTIFDEVEAATRNVLAAGLPLYYSVCIFRHLLEEDNFARLIALAKERGVTGMRVLYPICSGNWIDAEGNLLSPDERAFINSHVDNEFVFVAENMDDPDFEGCGAVSGGTIFVSPYGDVQPCNFVPVLLGNVHDEPLDIIIDRGRRHGFFTEEHQRAQCPMMSPSFVRMLDDGIDPNTELYALGDYPVVELEPGCNNGCDGCPARRPGPAHSALERATALLDGEPLEYGDVWIRGGEPFLHPEVFDVVAAIRDRGRGPCVVTNARAFAYAATVRKAEEAGVQELHVPVWGGSPDEYDDHVQVQGGFQHLLKALTNLAGTAIKVVVYVDAEKDTADLVEVFRAVGADRVVSARLDGRFYCDTSRPFGRFALRGARVLHVKPEAPARHDVVPIARDAKKKALVVVPPLDLTAMGLRDFTPDYITDFPLSALKLLSHYRGQGFDVGYLDGLNTWERRSGNTRDLLKESRIERHAECGNYANEGLTRPIYRVGVTRDELDRLLRQFPADVDEVAIPSIFTYSWRSTWDVIELAKRRFPHARVRLGGIYPTLCHEHALGSGADEVVAGHVPEIASEWLDVDVWKRFAGGRMALKASYGCNRSCSYCAVGLLEGRFSRADDDDLFRQLDTYVAAGLKELHFWDSDIAADRAHFDRILDYFIELNREITLGVPSGFALHTFDVDLGRKMRQAGFRNIVVPVETTRRDKLKEFHRAPYARGFESVVAAALEAGFEPHNTNVVLMIGYPEQTREDLLEDLRAVVRTGGFIDLRVYTPIPGTGDYERYRDVIGQRPIEDLDSFLFPMASPELPAQLLEDVYKVFNRRRFSPADILAKRGEHYLFEALAEGL